MARWTCWLLLLAVVLPAVVQLAHHGGGSMSMFARAEEDEVEGEDAAEDEGTVESEAGAEDEDDESATGDQANVHGDADVTLMFIKPTFPAGIPVELPAGQVAEFLVGFNNKGESTEFVVEGMDASLRYPLDFTYHVQNFSAVAYQKTVTAGQEASVIYSFVPADAFAGRPIGLTVNLIYKDGAGIEYSAPVFNETVQIVEFAEGFDTEVVFMYVFLVAGGLLVLFLMYSFVAPKTKGKKPASRPVETGTANDDVDYEWIPRSALRTPASGKASPRQRKSKRNAGSDTD